jgi:hypothetical protein
VREKFQRIGGPLVVSDMKISSPIFVRNRNFHFRFPSGIRVYRDNLSKVSSGEFRVEPFGRAYIYEQVAGELVENFLDR